MERYQLSADFAEKQLQVLERKYGGEQAARQAALTIQRAFRRYSMVKKFADLTAHIKAERRISRRLDASRASGDTVGSLTASPVLGPLSPGANSAAQRHHRPVASHTWQGHHQYHNPKCIHRQRKPPGTVSAGEGPSRSMGLAGLETPSASPVLRAPEAGLTHPHSEGGLLSTSYTTDHDANNSCPDIQSFPLDETSVYAHTLLGAKFGAGGGSPHQVHPVSHMHQQHAIKLAVRSSSLHRDNSSASLKKSNSSSSGKSTSSGPHAPRRTMARIASMDNSQVKRTSPHAAHLLAASHASASVDVATTETDGSLASRQNRRNQYHMPHFHHHHHHPHLHPSVVTPHHGSPSATLHLAVAGSAGGSGSPYGQTSSSTTSNGGSGSTLLYRSSDANTYTVNEVLRKRHYRTGLNIFNKKPEKGIAYLIRRGFLENLPQAVARFLITRKGLSKQMIGEYLGNLNHSFNMSTLNCFASELDFSDMHLDLALRKFQTYFRMPGEAQKIERLMKVFSDRYALCNSDVMAKFHATDTIFILAFAIILLNTDLHTPSLKPEKRMKVEDFVRNLRGIDDGHDVDHELLTGIYERIRSQEFRPGSDHVTQVMKVQQTIVAKCPNLALPHRRLVCYCRLYEVPDPHKKERPGIHQREVFLFNDILVMTKIHSRKKNSVSYAFRRSFILAGMVVKIFQTQYFPYGIEIAQKWDGKAILMLNARNDHDRSKFVEDLKESIAEMDELEAIRLESELEKQRHSMSNDNCDTSSSLQASTAVGSFVLNPSSKAGASPSDIASQPRTQHNNLNNNNNYHHNNGNGPTCSNGGVVLRRSAINNSLLDLSDAAAEKLTRRGSVGSLDSGMSISFQSNSVGSFCIGNGHPGGVIGSSSTGHASSRREHRQPKSQGHRVA